MVLVAEDRPVHDIEGVAGTEYRRVIQWRDENGELADFTGYEVRGQVREEADSTVVLLDLDLSLAGSEITLVAMTLIPMRGWYDVELVPPVGNPVYVVGGKFRMKQGVTQP